MKYIFDIANWNTGDTIEYVVVADSAISAYLKATDYAKSLGFEYSVLGKKS